MHTVLYRERTFIQHVNKETVLGHFLGASQLITLNWDLGSLWAWTGCWQIIFLLLFLFSLFFFCRQQQGQLVYLGCIRKVWAARGVTFQKRFLFKLCVFRKLPCSDLILGIQLSDGVSSIKGDRENKSLPSKDGVCLWQGLQMRHLWTSFFLMALWLKMGREERKSAVS